MKLPPRLLQFGTLALFSSMIGSLVLYRGGIFEATPSLPTWFSQVKQDSLQPPWFDSVQFKQILRETTQERLSSENFLMYGSKSAPPAPPPPQKKKKRERKPAELEAVVGTRFDTLIAMNILRTRYDVAHLSVEEAPEFRQIYAALQTGRSGYEELRVSFADPNSDRADSSLALAILRYGPQHLPRLSEQEKARFKVVLDSLTRPRMMSSKSGVIFISAVDTTQAIKIVKSEKHLK
ncbi:MAG: hypothetical protein H7246_22475 [Phycisphaerae bacterium]|nr:hypothetical protein [Saprospiraceae bacterium]